VQAQDYPAALWAVGLRTRGAVEGDVERAVAERAVVRTWPMRGTLHFVAAADVRWMLELLTPRVLARSAGRYRQLELDAAAFSRARKAFSRALEGGKQLTRAAMYRALESAGVSPAGQRGIHVLSHLSQEGLLCFGAREGKQQTFALLEEWVPRARKLERDEALAELARRYFTSHGPATLKDFVWWSGLTVADARAGREAAGAHLAAETAGGETYWLSPSSPAATGAAPAVHLLPVYDEYTVAYRDRSAVLVPEYAERREAGNGIFSPSIVARGQVVGVWKRVLKRGSVVVTPIPFRPLSKAERGGLAAAAERYGAFLGATGAVA
jgi:hypothetical protein